MSDVTRRLIGEQDLESVVAFLATGFPSRSKDCWRRGILRQEARAGLPNAPRFGAILESEGRIVGIVLSIFSSSPDGGTRCNFSSWYVTPGFEAYALLLTNFLLQDRTVTFFNLSPAPHTRPIIEAQGFEPYDHGWFLTMPALRFGGATACVEDWSPTSAAQLAEPDRTLLSDHHAMGCLCFVVRSEGTSYPFVFSTKRRLGPLAVCFLIHCRDIAEYRRLAGPLGRALLRRGILSVILDRRCAPRLGPGRLISRDTIKYFRGPNPPRPGDNSYSELALFDA